MRILMMFALALSFVSVNAEAGRAKRVVLEEAVADPLHCDAKIAVFAVQNGLTRQAFGDTDYYLLDETGEKVGNGYYSQGMCYIYIDE